MPVIQTPAKADGVRPILNTASLVLVGRVVVSGCTGYGGRHGGKRMEQKCRQSHLNSHRMCLQVSGAPGTPPPVAVCLLSSATSSSQPHATDSLCLHSEAWDAPASHSSPAPHQSRARFPCLFQLCCCVSFPLPVTLLGSAPLVAVSTCPLTDTTSSISGSPCKVA